jgi:glutamate---cysteine ligase / carboxylate-amine ligase
MSREAEDFTLGIEEEFQIIDPVTYALSSDAAQIIPPIREVLGTTIQHELMLSQIEVATPVCHSLAQARVALTHQRHTIIECARQAGKRIAAAGTHPFSRWYDQLITPKKRYEALVEDYGQLIEEQVIFGCHVHVGLKNREIALQVMNRTRIWLPLLLALSANSPFWHGRYTSYASFRTGRWWTSPLTGPPPFFSARNEYDRFIQTLIETKSVEDTTRLYWDIRLPERYQTIEFRVMDVCMTIDESVMLAGLIRALVQICYEAALQECPFPTPSTELLRVANWRAARYGLEGSLIDPTENRLAPAHELIENFLALLRPALEMQGDWEEVAGLTRHALQYGSGAARQCAVFARTQNMEDVVQYIIDETAKGCNQE